MSDKKHYHHKKPKQQDNYKPPFSEAVLAEPITNLSLREETAQLLLGAGVNTVGDVLKRTENDFYKIMRFNKKNLMDVKFAVKKRDLFLKPLPEPVEGGANDAEKENAPAQAKQQAKPQARGQEKQPSQNNKTQQQGKGQPAKTQGQNKPLPQGQSGGQNKDRQKGKQQNGNQNAKQQDPEKSKNRKPQIDTSYVMTTLIKRPPKPQKETVKEEQDKYVKVNKNGLWGFKERNSKEMPVPAVYDEVFNFHDDLCCVQKGEKFGFVNRQGEEVIPLVYDCATSFSEGLACVYKGETCGYINKQNETVIEFKFDAGTPVIGGECRVKKAGKWGELHVENPGDIRWII